MMRPRVLQRRDFVLALGAALASPRLVRAQQRAMPLIGLLDTAAGTAMKLTNYYEGLKIEGFVRNQSVAVEYHSADSDYARLPALAADLVARKVSLIAALGAPAALAAKAATSAIPIVFAVAPDPVQLGLIPSLNRPGGNATGVANMAVGREQKRLELLHEINPTATLLALLINPRNPNAEAQTRDALAAAHTTGVQIKTVHASSESDFDGAFADLVQSHAGGLAVSDDEFFVGASVQLAALAIGHKLPAVYQGRAFTMAGGVMSYGNDLTETYHQAGVFSGLILKGAASADLPVFQSTKVEFIVNVRAATALGIAPPQALLDSASAVIR